MLISEYDDGGGDHDCDCNDFNQHWQLSGFQLQPFALEKFCSWASSSLNNHIATSWQSCRRCYQLSFDGHFTGHWNMSAVNWASWYKVCPPSKNWKMAAFIFMIMSIVITMILMAMVTIMMTMMTMMITCTQHAPHSLDNHSRRSQLAILVQVDTLWWWLSWLSWSWSCPWLLWWSWWS